jgi:hypothetical protein
MNTNIRPCAAHALTALLLTLAIAGCSKRPTANTEPLVTAPAATDDASTIRASIALNGMQAKYIAHLKNARIASIDEERSTQEGRSAHGTYSFYEARLVKYSGEGFKSLGHEQVEFDLRGAVKQAQSDGGTPSTEEIGAIRNRAELLRSHALTQQAVQAHRY